MADDFTYDVFLSHSAADKAATRAIAERLRSDGLRVWFDESGESSQAQTEARLEQSRVLVFCLSANTFGSDRARFESYTFRFRDPLDKERRFIPLRLDDAPIEGKLAQFLPLNWLPEDREQEYEKLLEACRPVSKSATAEEQDALVQPADEVITLSIFQDSVGYAFSPDRKRVLAGGYSGSEVNNTFQLWEVKTGRCLRVFEAHTDEVQTLAWNGVDNRALSGSQDCTVRLWDIETGRCLRVFRGHKEGIECVAWSADGRFLASGSYDKTVRLWNAETGRCLRVLRGHHTAGVEGVAWSADGRFLASGSSDKTVRLWETKKGRCLRVLEGHTSSVNGVAWSADGRFLASGSTDHTMRLWNVETGRCLRVLEGHTTFVDPVEWSADGRFLLSGSGRPDASVRLWEVETGRCLRVLTSEDQHIESVVWSADRRHVIAGDIASRIHVWDVSELITGSRVTETAAPTSTATPDQVQYTNAKVLLVGDTGVGKSGLAERLVNKQFVPTKSSHARKAYLLESQIVQEPSGISLHRETVLWDLAGQPAYRLVHQLSMENAALACVLFDCHSETNPFEGAAYWSQVLDQARTNTKLKKLLIASRIDVGGLPAGRERIETFRSEHGFTQFIPTSANTGEGCDDLLEAISQAILWGELPKVTTTRTLAALRDYVARLKGEHRDADAKHEQQAATVKLFSVSALHEGFGSSSGEKIPLEEFIAHLQRLEATDEVHLLVFRTTGVGPLPETLVLLDPTRVDAYASALLVAAKDEPDGPGHLLESRVRDGGFKLDREERLADRESERRVLWYVMENLLSRDLALRERIKGEDYIVFPSQCTAELEFPGVAAFGVAFTFNGPVRSIYATLIAQLAHYEGFKSREFFRDAAAYRAGEGGRCLIRFRDHGYGRGELEALFDGDTPASVRQGFLEFIGQHLAARSNLGSVTKRHAYHCTNPQCGEPFDDRVVKASLAARRKDLLCPFCWEKTRLVNLLTGPTRASESVAAQIAADARTGRQRMTARLVIKAKEAEGKFDVFLSHNSKDKAAVEKIAKRLLTVGLRPWLDKWNLSPGDTVSDALAQAVEKISCAALCFGPADIGKWHIMEIRAYLERWASGTARMIPVILPNVEEMPDLPIFIRQTLWVDMRDWEEAESDSFYRLVCGILGKAPGDSPMRRFGVRDVAEWQGTGF